MDSYVFSPNASYIEYLFNRSLLYDNFHFDDQRKTQIEEKRKKNTQRHFLRKRKEKLEFDYMELNFYGEFFV